MIKKIGKQPLLKLKSAYVYPCTYMSGVESQEFIFIRGAEELRAEAEGRADAVAEGLMGGTIGGPMAEGPRVNIGHHLTRFQIYRLQLKRRLFSYFFT